MNSKASEYTFAVDQGDRVAATEPTQSTWHHLVFPPQQNTKHWRIDRNEALRSATRSDCTRYVWAIESTLFSVLPMSNAATLLVVSGTMA
jgi:hypothetical protein